MEIKVSARYVRISALKARETADLVRGRDVNEAFSILAMSRRKAGPLIEKLLKSAVAAAEQKQTIDTDSLYIKSICVNQGPHLKRFRPRARGSSSPLKKKQSHIELELEERRLPAYAAARG